MNVRLAFGSGISMLIYKVKVRLSEKSAIYVDYPWQSVEVGNHRWEFRKTFDMSGKLQEQVVKAVLKAYHVAVALEEQRLHLTEADVAADAENGGGHVE